MFQIGDTVLLPNGKRAAIQGWAIEKGLLEKGKPYRKSSRRQAIASGNPLVEVWILSKPTSEPTEFWPLAAVRAA